MNSFLNYFLAFIMFFNILILPRLALADTCVGGGPLDIFSWPSTMNFPSVPPSVLDQTNTLSFSTPISFEDLRGSAADFTLDVTVTDFEDLSNNSLAFALTQLTIVSDDNDTINLIACDDATGITLTQLTPVAFTDTNLDGTSDPMTLVSGDVRARIGAYSIDPQLVLTLPGGTGPGNYRTTLSFSLY